MEDTQSQTLSLFNLALELCVFLNGYFTFNYFQCLTRLFIAKHCTSVLNGATQGSFLL